MNRTPVAVIFLADSERAVRLAEQLQLRAIEPVVARNADDFYRSLNSRRVDLIILANELPTFLSGEEMLESLYHGLLSPPTILLAEPSGELRHRVRAEGGRLMSPGCRLDELVASAQELLAASPPSQTAVPLAARKLAQNLGSLLPWPPVLLRLTAYLDLEQASLSDFAHDLAQDPGTTAALLHLMNSTAFGLRRKVTSPLEAVTFLGIRQSLSVLHSAAVIEAHQRIFRKFPHIFRHWYAQRYVLIATTALGLAHRRSALMPERIYLLGLVQDLGILLLAQTHDERYMALLRRWRRIGQPRLDQLERSEFGTTHAEVSAAVLEKWQWPERLVDWVLNHHEAVAGHGASAADRTLLRIMQIGEAVANLAETGAPQHSEELSQLLALEDDEQAAPWKPDLEASIGQIADSSRQLALPSPDKLLLEQLRQRIAGISGLTAVAHGIVRPPAAPDLAAAKGSAPSDLLATLPPAPFAPGPAPAARHSVLIIDDDEVSTYFLVYFLNSAGIDAIACGSAAEAKPLASRAGVILCDVHLKGESGIDFVRALRADGFQGPVLMISSDRTRATVEECIDAGIVDYILKPFERPVLLEKLRRHAGFIFRSYELTEQALTASSETPAH